MPLYSTCCHASSVDKQYSSDKPLELQRYIHHLQGMRFGRDQQGGWWHQIPGLRQNYEGAEELRLNHDLDRVLRGWVRMHRYLQTSFVLLEQVDLAWKTHQVLHHRPQGWDHQSLLRHRYLRPCCRIPPLYRLDLVVLSLEKVLTLILAFPWLQHSVYLLHS